MSANNFTSPINQEQISKLFSNILEELVLKQPDSPIDFLIDYLKHKKDPSTVPAPASAAAASPAPATVSASPAPVATTTNPPPAVATESALPSAKDEKTATAQSAESEQPVNAFTSRQRRPVVFSESLKPSDPSSTRVIPKTPEQVEQIHAAFRKNELFSSVDQEQLKVVIDALEPKTFEDGTVIIREGEFGDMFYLIDSGTCKFFKLDAEGRDVLVSRRGPGESFGELALMYNVPRAASVIADGPCSVWEVDRATFRQVLMNVTAAKRRSYEVFLARIPILGHLEPQERSQIADVLEEKIYKDGTKIVNEGDVHDHSFYMLLKGECIVTKVIDGEVTQVHAYHEGDYFGELALLNNQPRQATISASGDCTCVSIDRITFTRLLGPLEDILKRKVADYKESDRAAAAKRSSTANVAAAGTATSPTAAATVPETASQVESAAPVTEAGTTNSSQPQELDVASAHAPANQPATSSAATEASPPERDPSSLAQD